MFRDVGEPSSESRAQIFEILLAALDGAQAAVCLCDGEDRVRYANPAFNAAFFPNLPERPVDFIDAIAADISAGVGIKLESMTLEAFVARTKHRRRHGARTFEFSVDMVDGSWWRVNDHRLDNGWTLVIATDVSSLKQEESRLRSAKADAEEAARTDVLTGLRNRRAGLEHAEAAFEEFRRNRLPLTVAIIDLDRFKAVNDRFGHEAGDRVLIGFASDLVAAKSESDIVCRLGGEEFMAVMPRTSPTRGARRLMNLRERLRPVLIAGSVEPLRYSFSAGVTGARHYETFAAILARADAALYSAKVNGRDRIEVHRPDPG
ncbi:MAG TPA: GGDEF domain-containing protein, partial [Beijerinckiaceae bacterium]